jgi:hypothetical protein
MLLSNLHGITHRHTLGELIELNTDMPAADVPDDVFRAPREK